MHIAHNNEELSSYLSTPKQKDSVVGFIPTMGALHEGHLKLIHEAHKVCDFVVVSVFVNPRQFNNAEDLEKYPRDLEKDRNLLKREGVHLLYVPEVDEVYPKNIDIPKVELGRLGEVMEGKFREGHFDGVAQVIYRLFFLIKPDKAFFGLKDLQQVSVINKLVKDLNLTAEVEVVETSREPSGLARSSRNLRLSESDKEKATVIYKTLKAAQKKAPNVNGDYRSLEDFAQNYFREHAVDVKAEYVQLVDSSDFSFPTEKTDESNVHLCIAAVCNGVRLIDNMQLFP